MKLRNKKTGKVFVSDVIVREKSNGNGEYSIIVCNLRALRCGSSISSILGEYDSLTKFNEEWEGYKPAEPLIKDEKVRKFVRDWAEHWEIDEVVIRFIDNNRIDLIGFPSSSGTGREIDIQRTVVRNGIIYGNRYTINELCGEEE